MPGGSAGRLRRLRRHAKRSRQLRWLLQCLRRWRGLRQGSVAAAPGGLPGGPGRLRRRLHRPEHRSANCGLCGFACAAGETCQAASCVGRRGRGRGGLSGHGPDRLRRRLHRPDDGSRQLWRLRLWLCPGRQLHQPNSAMAPAGRAVSPGRPTAAAICIDTDDRSRQLRGLRPCLRGGRDVPAAAVFGQPAAPPLDCAGQGLTDCGGFCTDLTSDPVNCGNCGIACSPGRRAAVASAWDRPRPPRLRRARTN